MLYGFAEGPQKHMLFPHITSIVSSNGSLSVILIDYLDSNRWGNHHKTCYIPNPRLDPEVLQQRNLIGRLYRAAEKRAKSSHLGLRDPDAQAAGAGTWRRNGGIFDDGIDKMVSPKITSDKLSVSRNRQRTLQDISRIHHLMIDCSLKTPNLWKPQLYAQFEDSGQACLPSKNTCVDLPGLPYIHGESTFQVAELHKYIVGGWSARLRSVLELGNQFIEFAAAILTKSILQALFRAYVQCIDSGKHGNEIDIPKHLRKEVGLKWGSIIARGPGFLWDPDVSVVIGLQPIRMQVQIMTLGAQGDC